MKKADQWSALFLIFLAAFICWGSSLLPYGNIHDPGPGFLPVWLGIILGAMSLGLILKTTIEKGSRPLKNLLEEEVRWGRVLLVLIALFLFAYLLDIAGFVITTFILLASLLRFVYPQPWKTVIGWALAGSGVSYLIFDVWMKLRLPKGFLGI